MSLAIVESLPCGVVSTRPSARDGRAPPPCSCPTATTPSRGRNVRGRRGGGPPADHAFGSGSSARRALSLSLPECQIIISTRGRRVLTLLPTGVGVALSPRRRRRPRPASPPPRRSPQSRTRRSDGPRRHRPPQRGPARSPHPPRRGRRPPTPPG